MKSIKCLVVLAFMTLGLANIAQAQKDLTITVKGVSFTMKYVEGGMFNMGSNVYKNTQPIHSVIVSSFYMGETEVTQALWEAVMGSEVTYHGGWTDGDGRGDNYPAYKVSWNDCQDFIRNLNRLTGRNFCLPTETEWEYAARGGKMSKDYEYAGGNEINEVAWYSDNSGAEWEFLGDWEPVVVGGKTFEVKTKSANELGLYDMSGNVEEWCSDWYDTFYNDKSKTNPKGALSGSHRVLRGGSYCSDKNECSVSHRRSGTPDGKYGFVGFRLVFHR